MAKTYSWHQGSGCLKPHWAVPVPLLQDEIISSWLVRAALAQGCDPFVLTGEIWPQWRAWTTDIDRNIQESRLKTLSIVSGISSESFRLATLGAIVYPIHDGLLPEKTVWPWVLALGARNTKRRSGMQYCPTCLEEDVKPYFRIQWRLAWHTACQKHKCTLLDRCWNCGAPIEYHRLLSENKIVSACPTCKLNLKQAVAEPCPVDALAFQMEADQVVSKNGGCYFNEPVSVDEWFEITLFFISLARKACRHSTDRLVNFMGHMEISLPKGIPTMTGAGIELFRVHDRQKIFVPVWHLLSADKTQLGQALEKSGMTWQGLCDKNDSVPAQLNEVVGALANKPITRTKKPKPDQSVPLSRHRVMQMMNRLRRKFEMAQR